MKTARIGWLLSICGLAAGPLLAQTPTAPCSAATLNGPFELQFGARILGTTGKLTDVFEGVGTATFDGVSKVTMTGTMVTTLATTPSFTFSGTYTLPASCLGTLTLTSGRQASFSLVAWGQGDQFNISGTDNTTSPTPTFVWSGSGTSIAPPACAIASASGPYTYEVTGNTLSGVVPDLGTEALMDAVNEAGTLLLDGQGNVVSATYTVNSSQSAAVTGSGTGAYTVNSNCSGSATVKDAVSGVTRTFNFTIGGSYGQNLRMIENSPAFVGTGTAHNAFDNPSRSITNVANYAYSATPPGSVFALFGVSLAPKPGQATQVPLPKTLQNTSVAVNGTPVPLFYVDSGQIDAQLPWEISGNSVASVVVTAGAATSNAAAMYVPATGTPGISFESGTNRAVVVNKDGTVNAGNNAAAVGDEVVAYFTGGGPVNPAGKLTTGAAAPAGLSPVTDAQASITVGGTAANVVYIGLTPGSVGLYQANFNVPQVAKGTYPVVITISGTASNTLLGSQDPNPVMSVSN